MKRFLAVAATLVCLLAAGPADPAHAHPFGPPPTARVRASGSTVTIDWAATPDDAVAIGERLGIMPPGSVAAYRQEAAAQVAPSSRDEARLSASPQLREYLTTHIVVSQAGQPCEATVPPVTDFVHSGAQVVARCAAPVVEATLRITMLHDIHAAYRTVAVGTDTDPARSVFTVGTPEHTWRFGTTAGSSPAGALLVGGGIAVAAGAAAATLFLRRRNSTR